jgi:hypothetical protein
MYTGDATCGAGFSRCSKYRRNGTELAVITDVITNGNLSLVKNVCWHLDRELIARRFAGSVVEDR